MLVPWNKSLSVITMPLLIFVWLDSKRYQTVYVTVIPKLEKFHFLNICCMAIFHLLEYGKNTPGHPGFRVDWPSLILKL